MDNLAEGVQDETGFEIDQANEHLHPNSDMILSSIAEKYHEGSVLADLTVGERRRLEKTSLYDIVSADCTAVIRELKLESLTGFMISLEKDLNTRGKIHPRPDMIFKLHDITCLGTEAMKIDGTRIKKLFIKTVAGEIERKYDADTPLINLSNGEVEVLRYMRPLVDDTLYPETVLALHWRIIEQGLDEDLEKLASVTEYEVENVSRLIRLTVDRNVPEHIKTKAQELRKMSTNVIVERLPHKYNLNSNVDELTETEKAVLDRLDVIRNTYHPVVEYLHWHVTHLMLCRKYELFKAGNLEIADYMPKKLEFLSTNDRVPDITKQLAKEFQEAMSREKREASKTQTKEIYRRMKRNYFFE